MSFGKPSMEVCRQVIPLILAMLCLALIPTPVLGQPSDQTATGVDVPSAAVAFVPVTARLVPRFTVSAERIQVSAEPPQHVGSRDSLRNGAIFGAVIGAVALGAIAATLCHAYREEGGASCVPDTLRFAAIGGAIGTGAGLAIDAARSQRGVTVRFAITF
jgi:hypothetical protein